MGVGADRLRISFDRGNYHAVLGVEPQPSTDSITCDIVLDPGRQITGTVVGPDGKPLAGARVSGLKALPYWPNEALQSADFTAWGLSPQEPRLLEFVHEVQGLAGALLLKGDETGPVRVHLQPSGTLTGRFVTPEGDPLKGVEVSTRGRRKPNDLTSGSFPRLVLSGKDGRFRMEGIVPGLTYTLGVRKSIYLLEFSSRTGKNLKLKSGETKDLGDLLVRPME